MTIDLGRRPVEAHLGNTMFKFCAAVAATIAVFAAAPAAAVTLTFAMHVTDLSENAPPVDDFEMTFTFDPVFSEFGSFQYYYGEIHELVDTPQLADMLDVAGITLPAVANPGFAIVRTVGGNNASFELSQNIRRGDDETEILNTYYMQMNVAGIVPIVKYTPGGLVYLLQQLGELTWDQRAMQTLGYYDHPQVLNGERSYRGVARLVGASVEAENPAVPEPATWALMILGFGGVGTAMRRRRHLIAQVPRTAW